MALLFKVWMYNNIHKSLYSLPQRRVRVCKGRRFRVLTRRRGGATERPKKRRTPAYHMAKCAVRLGRRVGGKQLLLECPVIDLRPNHLGPHVET